MQRTFDVQVHGSTAVVRFYEGFDESGSWKLLRTRQYTAVRGGTRLSVVVNKEVTDWMRRSVDQMTITG